MRKDGTLSDGYVSTGELAELMHVSESDVLRDIKRGKYKFVEHFELNNGTLITAIDIADKAIPRKIRLDNLENVMDGDEDRQRVYLISELDDVNGEMKSLLEISTRITTRLMELIEVE